MLGRKIKLSMFSVILVSFTLGLVWIENAKADEMSIQIKNLRSKDPAVRKEAALALGETRDPSAVEPLINALKKDKDWNVRGVIEDALVNIGEPAVKPLTILLGDQDWHIRRRAARVLGEIRDPNSVEALATALNKDHDCCVRRFAAKALGETRDSRAAEILMAALKEKRWDVVAGAYRFFIIKGEPGTEVILIEMLNQNVDRRMIMDFVNSGNFQLSKAACERAKSRGYSVSPKADWNGPKWGAI